MHLRRISLAAISGWGLQHLRLNSTIYIFTFDGQRPGDPAPSRRICVFWNFPDTVTKFQHDRKLTKIEVYEKERFAPLPFSTHLRVHPVRTSIFKYPNSVHQPDPRRGRGNLFFTISPFSLSSRRKCTSCSVSSTSTTSARECPSSSGGRERYASTAKVRPILL